MNDFEISVDDIGDMSVGIQPLTIFTAKLDKNFVEQLKEDGTMKEFKKKLIELISEYCEPEVAYSVCDSEEIQAEYEQAYEMGRNL